MALRSPADRVEAFLDNFGPVSGAPNRLLTAARGLYLTQKDLRELIEAARHREAIRGHAALLLAHSRGRRSPLSAREALDELVAMVGTRKAARR